MTRAVVLTGAPGAGKTSVAEALGTLLEIEGVPYGAIESEQLGWGSPGLPREQWLAQLACVLEMQRGYGRDLFLVIATTETADELRGVLDAVAADPALVVCLRAAPDTVAARIEAREPDSWPGKRPLIEHARGLAAQIPALDGLDVVVDTDGRGAEDVAREIRAAMR